MQAGRARVLFDKEPLSLVNAAVEKLRIKRSGPMRDTSPVDLVPILSVIDFCWGGQALPEALFNRHGEGLIHVVQPIWFANHR